MKKQLKKEEILKAAAQVFRKKGYHAARIQDVADVLGMQKGSLYYYIKTKEDLLKGLVEDILEKSVELTNNTHNTTLSPADKIGLCIESHLRLFHENKNAFGVFMSEDLQLINKTSSKNIFDLIKEYEVGWEEMFTQGIKTGDFKKDIDYKTIVKSIFGMMNWSYRWYNPYADKSLKEVAQVMKQLVLSGIEK